MASDVIITVGVEPDGSVASQLDAIINGKIKLTKSMFEKLGKEIDESYNKVSKIPKATIPSGESSDAKKARIEESKLIASTLIGLEKVKAVYEQTGTNASNFSKRVIAAFNDIQKGTPNLGAKVKNVMGSDGIKSEEDEIKKSTKKIEDYITGVWTVVENIRSNMKSGIIDPSTFNQLADLQYKLKGIESLNQKTKSTDKVSNSGALLQIRDDLKQATTEALKLRQSMVDSGRWPKVEVLDANALKNIQKAEDFFRKAGRSEADISSAINSARGGVSQSGNFVGTPDASKEVLAIARDEYKVKTETIKQQQKINEEKRKQEIIDTKALQAANDYVAIAKKMKVPVDVQDKNLMSLETGKTEFGDEGRVAATKRLVAATKELNKEWKTLNVDVSKNSALLGTVVKEWGKLGVSSKEAVIIAKNAVEAGSIYGKNKNVVLKEEAKYVSLLVIEWQRYEKAARAAGISQSVISQNKTMVLGGTGAFNGIAPVEAAKQLATQQMLVNKEINAGTTAQNAFMKAFNLQKIFGYFSAWQVFHFTLQTLRDTLIELQNDLIRLEAVTGMTAEQAINAFQNIKKSAMEAGFTISETSKVYLEAARYSNNFSDAKRKEAAAIGLTRSALALSNITGQESAKSIEQLIGITESWGVTEDGVRKIMDATATVMQGSYANMSEMADALAKSGGVLQNAGLTLSESIGFIANISQKVPTAGISEITTAVGRIPEFLKSAEAEKAFQKFGIAIRTIDQNGNLVFKGLKAMIGEINRAMDDGRISAGQYSELITKIGGGARGARFVDVAIKGMDSSLKLGKVALDAYNNSTEENSLAMKLSGNTAQSLEKKLISLYDSFQTFILSLSQTKIAGMTLVDAFGKIIDALKIMFDVLSKIGPAIGAVFSYALISKFGVYAFSAVKAMKALKTEVIATGEAMTAMNAQNIILNTSGVAIRSGGGAATGAAAGGMLGKIFGKFLPAVKMVGGAIILTVIVDAALGAIGNVTSYFENINKNSKARNVLDSTSIDRLEKAKDDKFWEEQRVKTANIENMIGSFFVGMASIVPLTGVKLETTKFNEIIDKARDSLVDMVKEGKLLPSQISPAMDALFDSIKTNGTDITAVFEDWEPAIQKMTDGSLKTADETIKDIDASITKLRDNLISLRGVGSIYSTPPTPQGTTGAGSTLQSQGTLYADINSGAINEAESQLRDLLRRRNEIWDADFDNRLAKNKEQRNELLKNDPLWKAVEAATDKIKEEGLKRERILKNDDVIKYRDDLNAALKQATGMVLLLKGNEGILEKTFNIKNTGDLTKFVEDLALQLMKVPDDFRTMSSELIATSDDSKEKLKLIWKEMFKFDINTESFEKVPALFTEMLDKVLAQVKDFSSQFKDSVFGRVLNGVGFDTKEIDRSIGKVKDLAAAANELAQKNKLQAALPTSDEAQALIAGPQKDILNISSEFRKLLAKDPTLLTKFTDLSEKYTKEMLANGDALEKDLAKFTIYGQIFQGGKVDIPVALAKDATAQAMSDLIELSKQMSKEAKVTISLNMDMDLFERYKKYIQDLQKQGIFQGERTLQGVGVSTSGFSEIDVEKIKLEVSQRADLQKMVDETKKAGQVVPNNLIVSLQKLATPKDLENALRKQAEGGIKVEQISMNEEEKKAGDEWLNAQKNLIEIQKNQFDLDKKMYELALEKQKQDVVTRNVRLEAAGFAAAITTPVQRTSANAYVGGSIFDKNQNISEQTPINITINGDVYSQDMIEKIKQTVIQSTAQQVKLSTGRY